MLAMSREDKDASCPANIRAALLRAARALEEADDSAPRLTAEVLLGFVLGWDRARVLGSLPQPLSRQSWEQFAAVVQRRAAGVPLQYITGTQEFYGLSFTVNPAVLIPRPETELLVEKAVALAREGGSRTVRFVDVGTGSGCVAVGFAHEVRHSHGYATDVSPAALAVARGNIVRHRTDRRIELVCCDLLGAFRSESTFDFILCNLPYLAAADAGGLPRIVVDHEPHLALFGGLSGTETYSGLFPQARALLRRGGRLLFEIDPPRLDELREMLAGAGLVGGQILEDLRGMPRCIVARRNDG
jgi:release factor glutamine methyltransferase